MHLATLKEMQWHRDYEYMQNIAARIEVKGTKLYRKLGMILVNNGIMTAPQVVAVVQDEVASQKEQAKSLQRHLAKLRLLLEATEHKGQEEELSFKAELGNTAIETCICTR